MSYIPFSELGSVSISASANPGGVNGNIQYNNGGNFGGSSNVNWNDASNIFEVGGLASVSIRDDGEANSSYDLEISYDDGLSATRWAHFDSSIQSLVMDSTVNAGDDGYGNLDSGSIFTQGGIAVEQDVLVQGRVESATSVEGLTLVANSAYAWQGLSNGTSTSYRSNSLRISSNGAITYDFVTIDTAGQNTGFALKGGSNPGLELSTLSASSSGNFLTIDADRVIKDSGFSSDDFTSVTNTLNTNTNNNSNTLDVSTGSSGTWMITATARWDDSSTTYHGLVQGVYKNGTLTSVVHTEDSFGIGQISLSDVGSNTIRATLPGSPDINSQSIQMQALRVG